MMVAAGMPSELGADWDESEAMHVWWRFRASLPSALATGGVGSLYTSESAAAAL